MRIFCYIKWIGYLYFILFLCFYLLYKFGNENFFIVDICEFFL